MYEAIISPDEGILKKSVCKEGSQQEIASSDKDFDAEGWHTLQYIFIGNRIQLLIDGKSFFDYIDAQDGLAGGDIWIETGGSAEMLFDNFKAYEIVTFAAAPSATEAPSTSLPAEACAPGQKVLYVEDFQDGQAQGWNTIQSSLNGSEPFGWSVIDEEGNKILVEAKRSSGGDEMSRFTADNFVWHAKFKVSGNDAGVFFMWRISYTGDGMRKRYVAVFGAQEKPFMIRFLDEPSGTTPTNVGSGPRDMLKQDRWYDITIAYFNGTHQVWYDGKKQIEYQDANPFPAGTIGFETHLDESKASHFFIDDLVICELTAPYEPTQ